MAPSLPTTSRVYIWDLMAHMAIALTPSGELLGFAISSTEQRGKKVFLYELHVRQGQRGGIGTALMEMAERIARRQPHDGAERAQGQRGGARLLRTSAGLRAAAGNGGVAHVVRRKL